MYSKGMSTRDIEDHFRDIYGVEASTSLISRITDRIMPKLMEWQSQPLSEVYLVVFFDGINFKVKTLINAFIAFSALIATAKKIFWAYGLQKQRPYHFGLLCSMR